MTLYHLAAFLYSPTASGACEVSEPQRCFGHLTAGFILTDYATQDGYLHVQVRLAKDTASEEASCEAIADTPDRFRGETELFLSHSDRLESISGTLACIHARSPVAAATMLVAPEPEAADLLEALRYFPVWQELAFGIESLLGRKRKASLRLPT